MIVLNDEKYLNMSMEEFLKQQIFMGIHNHTHYSNLRLRDSIIKIPDLIDTAIKLNHRGINISDHEAISGHIEAMNYGIELHKKKEKYNEMVKNGANLNELKLAFGKSYEVIAKMPDDFKVALGNEIYLVDNLEEVRDNYKSGETKFYHFVLMAKNEKGHEALRELTSQAWLNLFKTGNMERVPIEKEFLKKVMKKYPNSLIASTACLGGELGQLVLELLYLKNTEGATESDIFNCKLRIHNFIQYCKEVFGDNFVIEIQPSAQEEQIEFNKLALTIANGYNIPLIIATDSHYLRPEHKLIHKYYLQSKDEERETDDFYSSTYVMSLEEMWNYWKLFGGQKQFKTAILNTYNLFKKVETYDLSKGEVIPQRELPEIFEIKHLFKDWYDRCEYIKNYAYSEYEQDRFFLHIIEDGFITKKQKFNNINIERINEELKQLWLISDRLKQRMASYYNLTQLLIEIMWADDGGNSIVGIARGSVTGFYTAYLSNITQINPIEWNLPSYRHIHSSRIELPDIDIDTETTKRDRVFNAVNNHFNGNVYNLSTFKTEGSKSAILTSARGLGIDNDIAQAIASLIPFERGKNWSLSDCLYGNEEKDRKVVKEFVNEISKYENWLETALMVEGIICGRSIHASGVVIFNNGITSQNAMMKAPNGKNITAFGMLESSQLGAVKLDFLTVESTTKLHTCLNLLLEYGKIEWQGSLKATYDKYLHPDVLEYNNLKMWELVSSGRLMDLFQFSTPIGISTAKLMKATNLAELAHANSLMRLMGDGTITPTEKFLKFKSDISLWYKEMEEYKLTKLEIKELEKHLLEYFGVSATQEDIMEMTMNPNLVGFNLTQANKLRKAVAKKSEKVMKEVRELYFKVGKENGNSENVLHYIWDKHILPQAGYAFSRNHTLPYSGIALQEMNLAFRYGELFWNTAVLIENSGANEEEFEDEDKKSKATEYGKIAKAIGEIKNFGVNISLPNINTSKLSFVPDEENNRIIFGLKGISGVGDDAIREILNNRPYSSFKDFYDRVGINIGNTTNIALIKAGVFDELQSNLSREQLLEEFIYFISEPVKKLTTTSILKLADNDLIPQKFALELRFYKFRKYIFDKKFFFENDTKTKTKKWYKLNNISEPFFYKYFQDELIEEKDYRYDDDGATLVLDKNFDKVYEKKIKGLKEFISKPEVLKQYNNLGYMEIWNKYCQGTISKWEMDSLNFYYHEHELEKLDKNQYNISNFFNLSEVPQIETTYKKGNIDIKIMKLYRICGTILDKNKNKNLLQVLTPDGVVSVKFHKGAFTNYNKQLSVVNEVTGKKTVVEKSWFSRGNKVMIVGFRREDQFIAKRYANSIYQHTVELITHIIEDGTKVLTNKERVVL